MTRPVLKYLAAQWQQSKKEEPEQPITQTLFCLNVLPKQPNTRYIWKDDAVWDDTLYWID